MPIFMDRHDIPDATPDDLAQAHLQDLAVQDRFGVKYLSYWFDYDRHTAFCLVDAPDAERAQAVHAASHGLLPTEIIPVDKRMVEMFLGRIADPVQLGGAASAFRVIMFTDMQDSTRLTQRLGDEGAMTVVHAHDAIVREALRHHRGREVKHTGDGIMASFERVTDALAAAIEIDQTVAERNRAAVAPEEPFRVRIGIAAGEPVTEQGDLFGATVQLAARLCEAADPGEIYVSEAVRTLAIGKRARFGPMTELHLKGFDEPVRAARLLWDDVPARP